MFNISLYKLGFKHLSGDSALEVIPSAAIEEVKKEVSVTIDP